MEQPEAIIFDFDGTLVDLDKFIESYTRNFLAENKISTPLSIKDFYKEINTGTADLDPILIEKFKADWKESMVRDIPLIEGADEVVRSLRARGVKLGIVSTGYKERLNKILEAKGLNSYFDVLIGKEDITNHKPDPEGILKAFQKLGVSPENTLYVGDNQVDIMAGKAAGVKTGFFARNKPYTEYLKSWLEENKPDYRVEKFEDLINIYR